MYYNVELNYETLVFKTEVDFPEMPSKWDIIEIPDRIKKEFGEDYYNKHGEEPPEIEWEVQYSIFKNNDQIIIVCRENSGDFLFD